MGGIESFVLTVTIICMLSFIFHIKVLARERARTYLGLFIIVFAVPIYIFIGEPRAVLLLSSAGFQSKQEQSLRLRGLAANINRKVSKYEALIGMGDHSIDNYWNLARMLELKQEFGYAYRVYSDALQHHPEYSPLYERMILLNINKDQGDITKETLALVDRLHVISPKNIIANHGLAMFAFQNESYSKAIAIWQSILSEMPLDEELEQLSLDISKMISIAKEKNRSMPT